MRDDDTFDDAPPATPPAGRSDDVPSSEQTPTPWLAERRPAWLAGIGSRAQQRLTDLWAVRPASSSELTELLGRRSSRRTVLAGVVCCLGLATFAQATGDLTGHSSAGTAADGRIVQRADERAASRSMDRAAAPATPEISAGSPASSSPAEAQSPPAAPASSPANPDTAAPARPAAPAKIEQKIDPGPVAGLTEAQMDNAKAIVRTGRDMGVPRRGLIIAVATSMQESNLLNLASGVLTESMNHPNQGVGWDHDSVGLFQQRSSSGWGPVGRLMDPAFATAQFLTALEHVPGWQQKSLTDAAQAVQVSGFPYAYAQHESRATEVVDAIVPGWS